MVTHFVTLLTFYTLNFLPSSILATLSTDITLHILIVCSLPWLHFQPRSSSTLRWDSIFFLRDIFDSSYFSPWESIMCYLGVAFFYLDVAFFTLIKHFATWWNSIFISWLKAFLYLGASIFNTEKALLNLDDIMIYLDVTFSRGGVLP